MRDYKIIYCLTCMGNFVFGAVDPQILASCEPSMISEPLCPGTIATLQCTTSTPGPISAQWNFLNVNPCGRNISQVYCYFCMWMWRCGDYIHVYPYGASIHNHSSSAIYMYALTITADPSINGLSIQYVVNNSTVLNLVTVRIFSKPVC